MDEELLKNFIALTCKSEKVRKAKYSYIQSILVNCKPLTLISFDSFLGKKLKNDGGSAMYNKYIQALRTYSEFNKRYYNNEIEWIDKVRQKKEVPLPKQILSTDEIKQFLALPPRENQSEENHKKWFLFWSILCWTGCRLGEIRCLRIENVDFGNNRLFFSETKTGSGDVPLVDVLIPLLTERISAIKGHCLFPSNTNKNVPMTEKSYQKDFEERILRLGIKRKIRAYSFRDTAIVRWLRSLKLPIFDVKRLARHAKTSTTEGYFQLADLEELRQSLNNDPALGSYDPIKVVRQVEKTILEVLKESKNFNQSKVRQAISQLYDSVI